MQYICQNAYFHKCSLYYLYTNKCAQKVHNILFICTEFVLLHTALHDD